MRPYYTEKQVLTGRDATEQRLRMLIPDADVVHVASHCLVDDTSPWQAELVLAKPLSGPTSTANDGVLQLKEISELNLHHTRLVVLSACQSAMGQYYRGEGLASLVRPFIAARVPMVVASLWKVES
ncbi:MAG: CHAT domain-containing protein, partial [Blastocatellia bacterium]